MWILNAVERVEEKHTDTVHAEVEDKPVKALTAEGGPEKCA